MPSACSPRGDPDACCMGLKSPSIILRNLLVPEDMWDAFPKGLGLSVSDYFLYQPHFPKRVNAIEKPTEFGMNFEEIWITTADRVRLHAYLIKHRSMSPTLPTLIFFHGNAGNIGDRLENVNLLHRCMPVNIFLVEYRGYGISEGQPSEKGLYRDARAAFKYVEQRTDLDPRKIIVFGRSLGGAVAIDLCTRKEIVDKVAGLIVENTFKSIPAMAKSLFPFKAIKYLPRFFYSNKYENERKVSKLKCPVLFVSGSLDEIIPMGMMDELFSNCGSKDKHFKTFPSGHNDTWCSPGYVRAVFEFLNECVSRAEDPTGKAPPSTPKSHISGPPSVTALESLPNIAISASTAKVPSISSSSTSSDDETITTNDEQVPKMKEMDMKSFIEELEQDENGNEYIPLKQSLA